MEKKISLEIAVFVQMKW